MGVHAISSVRKVIFIITSNFTKETIQKYGDTIRLIDGDELMDLLITYEFAVNVEKATSHMLWTKIFLICDKISLDKSVRMVYT